MVGGGSKAVVQYLFNSSADPMKANNRGITPLHCAAGKGYYKIAEYLLSIGDNVDPIDTNGEAPLHVAAGHGHEGIVTLLTEDNANRNRQTHDLITPLVASLFCSSLECLQTLIQAGADICTGSPVTSSVAACNDLPDCIKCLLDNECDIAGAAVNAGSPLTPLMIAAGKGLTDCIKCLLKARADANIPDENGKLPVQIAARQGWKECVKILFPVTTPVAQYADRSTALLR